MKLKILAHCISIALLVAPIGLRADRTQANDDWITRTPVQAAAGQHIPAGAFGIATIARPRLVNLLDLRGMAGQGQIILRGEDSKTCLSFPFRFVAGDLRGHRISGHLSDPIHLVLQSRRVAKKLANGYSVVSDEVRVSDTPHPKADILVRTGMDENFGFVLNPGRNITADIFGISPTKIPCTAL